jgi:hypothetical protein
MLLLLLAWTTPLAGAAAPAAAANDKPSILFVLADVRGCACHLVCIWQQPIAQPTHPAAPAAAVAAASAGPGLQRDGLHERDPRPDQVRLLTVVCCPFSRNWGTPGLTPGLRRGWALSTTLLFIGWVLCEHDFCTHFEVCLLGLLVVMVVVPAPTSTPSRTQESSSGTITSSPYVPQRDLR